MHEAHPRSGSRAPAASDREPARQSRAISIRTAADAANGAIRSSGTPRAQPDGCDVGKAQQAQPADLQQPGQRGRRRGEACLDHHAIVGDQVEAAVDQSQQQVGLADAGAAEQQDGGAAAGGTAPVQGGRAGRVQPLGGLAAQC